MSVPTPRLHRLLLILVLGAITGPSPVLGCQHDAECGCDGSTICAAGACVAALTLPVFPVGVVGASPYATPVIAALDHAGAFYTGCCDTRITVFTGESAERDANAVLCPAAPTFPACLFASCLCGYAAADASPFVVNGSYAGVVGPSHLQYDGHAGWDYEANAGVPLVATRAGSLCKAIADPVNGTAGQPTAWDGFHSFYIDHGVIAGAGWASWYLHASDLSGGLAALAPGECAPVTTGQQVALAGNAGTFVPHLHFEVRRYEPADGPEAFSAKVVDPYGWRGTMPDPWTEPAANPQAAPQGPALWRACGNGRVECGEACDDGNVVAGDCCSASCQFEAGDTPCGTGANPCADERCNGAGACVDVATPRAACRAPILSGAATLSVTRGASASADRVQWKWGRGAATTTGDFGDPTTVDGYRLCAFTEAPTPVLVFGAAVPAGGLCPAGGGSKPCWSAKGSPPGQRGFRYRDRDATPDGVESALVLPGAAGAAKIQLKGRGGHLVLPGLPLALPLRVQLWADAGTCWEARYVAAGVQRNDATRLKARSE